jgi:hypothetical protein
MIIAGMNGTKQIISSRIAHPRIFSEFTPVTFHIIKAWAGLPLHLASAQLRNPNDNRNNKTDAEKGRKREISTQIRLAISGPAISRPINLNDSLKAFAIRSLDRGSGKAGFTPSVPINNLYRSKMPFRIEFLICTNTKKSHQAFTKFMIIISSEVHQ